MTATPPLEAGGHTPLPWHLFTQNSVIEIWDRPEADHAKAVVHWVGFDNAQGERAEVLANASYIVRACNSFPELLEALEEVRRVGDDKMATRSEWADAVAKADAAIARARSERQP